MNMIPPTPEVFTLQEAANFLRIPPEALERNAIQGTIPGRLLDNEWRFLKAALEDWLRQNDTRGRFLQQAGAFAGNDMIPELLASIYKHRGRPEVEK
jgi:hypothetical protein